MEQMLGVARVGTYDADHKAYDAVISNMGFVNSVPRRFHRGSPGYRMAIGSV